MNLLEQFINWVTSTISSFLAGLWQQFCESASPYLPWIPILGIALLIMLYFRRQALKGEAYA